MLPAIVSKRPRHDPLITSRCFNYLRVIDWQIAARAPGTYGTCAGTPANNSNFNNNNKHSCVSSALDALETLETFFDS